MQTDYQSELFTSDALAEAAVGRLQTIGYGLDHVSAIVSQRNSGLERGAAAGGAAGGLLGAILAVAGSTIAIASTGGAAAPFVAGPLVAALTGLGAGVAGGAIVGGLIGLGEHADDWHERLSDGCVVVAVTLKTPSDRDAVHQALHANDSIGN
jgi:hypothetical protein